MRTVRIKTTEYTTAADWTPETWADTPHPATLASKMHRRVSRRWDTWSGRSRWAESLRIGWAIFSAINEARTNLHRTVVYNDASLASFAEVWNRQGDFLTVSSGDFYVVVDLRDMSVLYAPAAPRFRMVDALDFADGKNWDRQIVERTWVFVKDNGPVGPQSVEAYAFGQTDNWTGD